MPSTADGRGRTSDGWKSEGGKSCRRNDTPNADRPTDNIGIGGVGLAGLRGARGGAHPRGKGEEGKG